MKNLERYYGAAHMISMKTYYAAPRVIIANDDPLITVHLKRTLRQAGCHVLGCTDHVKEAIELIENTQPDLVCMGYTLGSQTSEIVAEYLFRTETSILVVSNAPDIETIMGSYAATFCKNPFVEGAIDAAVWSIELPDYTNFEQRELFAQAA